MNRLRDLRFRGSAPYWEERYAAGGDSGAGSGGALAEFKAKVLDEFVREHGVQSVLELGCGDGRQLALADYPQYVGLDVSPSAIARCRERFRDDPSKSFFLYDPTCFVDRAGVFRADLVLSLDVLYHLVEDPVFEAHLRHAFGAARRFVIVYASDFDAPVAPHVRHRHFTPWLAEAFPEWRLVRRIENPFPKRERGDAGSFAEFFVFAREGSVAPSG